MWRVEGYSREWMNMPLFLGKTSSNFSSPQFSNEDLIPYRSHPFPFTEHVTAAFCCSVQRLEIVLPQCFRARTARCTSFSQLLHALSIRSFCRPSATVLSFVLFYHRRTLFTVAMRLSLSSVVCLDGNSFPEQETPYARFKRPARLNGVIAPCRAGAPSDWIIS